MSNFTQYDKDHSREGHFSKFGIVNWRSRVNDESPTPWGDWQALMKAEYEHLIEVFGRPYTIHKNGCNECGDIFYSHRPARYCSGRCANDAAIKRRKYYRKLDNSALKCSGCGQQISGNRSHAQYCSNSCRQADYRVRKAKRRADARESYRLEREMDANPIYATEDEFTMIGVTDDD